MPKPRNADRTQIRSERMSLALSPGAFNGVKLLAAMQGISVNEFVASMIENVVTKNETVIDEFAAAQRKALESIDLSGTTSDN